MGYGTVVGGIKASKTNKRLYGETFYSDIGKLSHASWVANGRKPRGFSLSQERASEAGAVGGKKSKRTYVLNGEGKQRYKRERTHQIPVRYEASLTFPNLTFPNVKIKKSLWQRLIKRKKETI